MKIASKIRELLRFFFTLDGMPLLLGGASVVILTAVTYFEHGLGLEPCIMCLWQRWPHRLVAVSGVIARCLHIAPVLKEAGAKRLAPAMRVILLAQAGFLVIGAGIAFWHGAVEYGFAEAPAACAAGRNPYAAGGGDAAKTLTQLLATNAVSCDKIAWEFAGLSMALWNGIISIAMAVLAVLWTRRRHDSQPDKSRKRGIGI